MSTGAGSVGGQSPIQTDQLGSHGIVEKPRPKAQGLNRSIEARNHPNYLPPPPPSHGRSQQSVPPDTSVHDRKSEVVEGKKQVGTESSGSTSPAKETTERTLKQKVAHVFGELKRFFKHENWKPVPRELIDGVHSTSLKRDLTARNEKVEALAELKEKGNGLEKKLVDFDKKFSKSLELYETVGAPPKRGKFPAPDGKTYDFSKAELFGDRKEMMAKFRAAFDKDAGFQSYDADRRELRRIRGTEDEPGKRAELKQEIRALSQTLKPRIDAAVAKEAEFRHTKVDREVESVQRKADAEVRQKWTEYRTELKALGEAVGAKKEALAVQKMEHEQRKDYEIPALKAKLKGIKKMRRQRLAEINDNKRLSPEHKQQAKARVEVSFKKLRANLEGQLERMESKVEAHSSDRKALKKEYHQAVDAQAKASKGKDFRKGVEEVREQQVKEEKSALKKHKAVPKEVEQERAAIRKGLQGRMNSTGIKGH
ncbi:hypothetical protein [Endozoicomonas numazuensis]|uniref:Uncharacterized protein n=1 Tax=Endozoicomonas numazuensis TaxID=1137799 RepID=A0A081NK46_9GAMM|nr:hypothetical protein [Endozoicomonas numazuensis]KEQ18819.1 hypothetical protein GZ78_01700 [Endozoicomonas numazuensis]